MVLEYRVALTGMLMIIIAAVALATLLAAFACSLFEAVLDALSPTDVETIRQTKTFGAERLGVLFANHQASRAAIVAIHTFSQIFGSIFCGATVVYFQYGIPALLGFALGFAIVMLYIGHILPQSLGAVHGYDLARWTAWPTQLMLWSVWPLVAVSRKLMIALIGSGDKFVPTQDEIMEMSRLAGQGGELRPQEVRLVENSLRLDEVRVYDLMTPRTVVYTLPADLPLSAVKERSEHWVHSRLPLTEDREPDRILGMVHRRDVFDALVKGNRNLKLRDLMRPIDFVPDTMRGHQVLDKFIKEKKHMAIVIDEYGGFEGVVTLEDVLECLLGAEIVDEHDRYPDMQQLARQRAQEKVLRQDAEASATSALAAESASASALAAETSGASALAAESAGASALAAESAGASAHTDDGPATTQDMPTLTKDERAQTD